MTGPPAGPPAGGPGGYPGPGPSPTDERNVAVLAHVIALIGLFGVPAIIGPVIVWLLARERRPYVDDQGKEAVNFQLSVLIYTVGLVALALVLAVPTAGVAVVIAILLALALAVFWFVMVIIAAVSASRGEWFRYPLTVRLLT